MNLEGFKAPPGCGLAEERDDPVERRKERRKWKSIIEQDGFERALRRVRGLCYFYDKYGNDVASNHLRRLFDEAEAEFKEELFEKYASDPSKAAAPHTGMPKQTIEESLTAQLGAPNFGALPVDRPHQAYVPSYRNMPDAELAKQKPGHPVSHPPHYTSHQSGVECIEVTRHMSFNCGNAVKYIWRHQDKGKPIQDLQKAIWYLQDEIKRITDAEIKRAEERGETHV